MAKQNSIIKGLSNSVRNTTPDKINNEEKEPLKAENSIGDNKPSENSNTEPAKKVENQISEIPKEKKIGQSSEKDSKVILNRINDVPAFIEQVKGWKRSKVSERSLVHLDGKYHAFLDRVRLGTNITKSHLVNYLVMDFLKNNPDFIAYVNEKCSSDSFDEE